MQLSTDLEIAGLLTRISLNSEGLIYSTLLRITSDNLKVSNENFSTIYSNNIEISTEILNTVIIFELVKTVVNLNLSNEDLELLLHPFGEKIYTQLHFSPFIDWDFDPNSIWVPLASNSSNQINISHLTSALTNYVTFEDIEGLIPSPSVNINVINDWGLAVTSEDALGATLGYYLKEEQIRIEDKIDNLFYFTNNTTTSRYPLNINGDLNVFNNIHATGGVSAGGIGDLFESGGVGFTSVVEEKTGNSNVVTGGHKDDSDIVFEMTLEVYSKDDTNDLLDTKVDKVAGYGLSQNNLTDELIQSINNSASAYHTHDNKAILDSITSVNVDTWDDAYAHSQITNGTNPHATTFANIASKPTTISGYGITDAYTKTYIDNNFVPYVGALQDVNLGEYSLSLFNLNASNNIHAEGGVSAGGIGDLAESNSGGYNNVEYVGSGNYVANVESNVSSLKVYKSYMPTQLSQFTDNLGSSPVHTHSQYLLAALKGTANGLAELDSNGLVPASQLPSYVDDVLTYSSLSAFPATGFDGKIYIASDTNLTYRWSGTAYVEISKSLALGETVSTAYRGDRGKVAYDHSQITDSNPHGLTKAILNLNYADGAQVNVIENITLNGGANLPITSKFVNVNACTSIGVPTGLSAASLTSGGVITLSYASGYAIPTIQSITDINTNISNHDACIGALAGQVLTLQSNNQFDELYAEYINVRAISADLLVGYLKGNADTATKLLNARTIWGKSFNGTDDISGAMTGVTTLEATGALHTTNVIRGDAGVFSGGIGDLSEVGGSGYNDILPYPNESGNAVTYLEDNGSTLYYHLGSFSLSTHNHNSVYSVLGHTHDDRYYTETEIGSILGGSTSITGYNKSNWDTAYTHSQSTSNPHGVTKAQVGLGNVENAAASGLYVPYTGANADVNIGYHTLAAKGVTISGNVSNSDIFTLQNTNTGNASYTRAKFIGTGRTWMIGVGNSLESILGVANKFYIYDDNASAVRMMIDTSGNTTFGGKIIKSGSTTSQFLKANGDIDETAYATAANLTTLDANTDTCIGSLAGQLLTLQSKNQFDELFAEYINVRTISADLLVGYLKGNADTATAFQSAKSITLTGDIKGTASSTGGWSIATVIGTGKVTNAMLAGSIDNSKLVNSLITIAGTTVSLGSSISAATLRSNLSISNVQNTAFYQRIAYVNGGIYAMAGTNTAAAFSIYAPTAAGTSGQLLVSSGRTPSWVSQGSGGGIDADLLDNLHASDFVNVASAQTITGVKTFNASVYFANGTTYYVNASGTAKFNGTNAGALTATTGEFTGKVHTTNQVVGDAGVWAGGIGDLSEGEWTTAILSNGTQGTTYGTVRYRKVGGNAQIDGSFTITWDGSSQPLIFTLPTSCCPIHNMTGWLYNNSNGIWRYVIGTDGKVTLIVIKSIADGSNITFATTCMFNNMIFPIN